MKRVAVFAILLFVAAFARAQSPTPVYEVLPWKARSDFLTNVTPCGRYVFLWKISDKGQVHYLTGFVMKTVNGEPGVVARRSGVNIQPLSSGTKAYVEPLPQSANGVGGGYTLYLPQSEVNEFNKRCAKILPGRTM